MNQNLNITAKIIQLLQGNIKVSWHRICQWSIEYDAKAQRKNRQFGPHQNLKLLCLKKQNLQSKTRAHRMGEHIFKSHVW